MTDRHANHHRLITERAAALDTAPSLYKRREAYKRAAWTLRKHLISEHGLVGRVPVRETLDEMLARHDALHT